MGKLKQLVTFVLFALFSLSNAILVLGEDTIVLTTQNFDEIMSQQDYIFVAMTQSHCSYCVKFEPEFKKLEKELGTHSPRVPIGHIDLVKNDELH